MFNPLSSISVTPLSAAAIAVDMEYINSNRETLFTETTSSLVYLKKYKILENLQDIHVDDYSINMLTRKITLSSVSTLDGTPHVAYFIEDEDEDVNKSVFVKSAFLNDVQFLLTAPLSSTSKISIIPLKNHISVTEDLSHDLDSRYYEKIYKDADDLFLQFKSNFISFQIQPDTSKTIYCADDIPTFPLSSIGLIENGAYTGTCPANSDNIFIDRYGYSDITDSGYVGISQSSEPLCVWTASDGLLERWYDPINVTQGGAFIAQKATDTFNSTVDISSTALLDSRSKFIVSRLGESRNLQYINSLSSNLAVHFTEWNNSFSDDVSNVEGFIVGTYKDINADRLLLDGTIHAHIPPSDALHDNANITVCLWANSHDWTDGIDTQLWGNFSNSEGYGLFYNTGATNELITLPSNNGTIYGFNFRGYRIFEKNIDSLSSSDFSYITTDYFGNRWIWDKTSQQIIKLSSDDIVTETITLPPSANIKNLKIDADNTLYALNTTSNTISSFDSQGVSLTAINVPYPYNDFDFLSNNALIFSSGDNTVVDKNNNIYTTIGRNIYKNNVVWFHIAQKIQSIKLDTYNNVYVFSGKNNLIKLDSSGSVLWDTKITLDNDIADYVEMAFVKEQDSRGDYDVLWIIFNERKILIKVDISSGLIIRRIRLTDVVNPKQCGNFELSIRGDFTGAEVKRKFQSASSSNPMFSAKVNLTCGNNSKMIQLYTPASIFKKGWVHLAMTHEIIDDSTKVDLYVNGILRDTQTLEGIYTIDFGTKVTPYIVGGNSGKLGAKNVERSLNNSGYFEGEISDIRIYSKTLEVADILSISRNKYWNKWTPLSICVPTPPRTYLEKMKKFHLNKYPGFKSNKFNLIFRGVPDKIPQTSLENFVRENIDNIKPAHMILNKIKFD